MRRTRKPPVNKEVRNLFISHSERVRIERGGFLAAITVYSRGQSLRINLIEHAKRGHDDARYYTRLIGNAYVVFDENPEAGYMPPYYGRRFATKEELTALMGEMLAAFIMLRS